MAGTAESEATKLLKEGLNHSKIVIVCNTVLSVCSGDTNKCNFCGDWLRYLSRYILIRMGMVMLLCLAAPLKIAGNKCVKTS